jgi:hypothetical protein
MANPMRVLAAQELRCGGRRRQPLAIPRVATLPRSAGPERFCR